MSSSNSGKNLIDHHGLKKVMNQLGVTNFPNCYGYCFNCEELQELPTDMSGKCINCPEIKLSPWHCSPSLQMLFFEMHKEENKPSTNNKNK